MKLVVIPTAKHRHLAVRVKRPGERRSASRSATRALDVLEAFGKARRPLRAIEIARLLELPASTVNQLLKTMAESAHLLFDARAKTYRPSPRLAASASWIAETYGVNSSLSDLVRDVSARTGCVATVTTPSDLFMQVIDLAGAEGAGGERGLKISLFGSAIGSAYLSTLEDSEVKILAERARMPSAEIPAILETLASIRQTGNASGPSADAGVWSIAIPLPMDIMNGQAVLGIAGRSDRLAEQSDHYCTVLNEAISRWLASRQPAGPESD